MSVGRRIRESRRAKGLTQEDLAQSVGVKQSAISSWENGEYTPKRSNINQFSKALDVSPIWLERGGDQTKGRSRTPLMGVVGAGAKIMMVANDPVDHVEPPPEEDGSDFEALEVNGNSQYPVYRDGDLVYYLKGLDSNPDKYMGEDCVVELDNGELMLKRILPGTQPGLYTLVSYNHPDDIDRRVVAVAPVVFVRKRRGRHH